VYRLCIAHDQPKTADPPLASPLRIRPHILKAARAQLLITIPTSAWIASFCGGVWFPKADLAQLPLGHRPALRPP
jgi:hypothetical protein